MKFRSVKTVLLTCFLIISVTNTGWAFTLTINSDTPSVILKVREEAVGGLTDIGLGKNEVNLENYPNAIYLYESKSKSKARLLGLVWVESAESIIELNFDENLNYDLKPQSENQNGLDLIAQHSRNIFSSPLTYDVEEDTSLEPVLVMEAKLLRHSPFSQANRKKLIELLKESEKRNVSNWATNIISSFVEHNVYDLENNQLNQVVGIDRDEEKIIVRPDGEKYLLLAISGSWCGPCVKSLPKMRKLHDKVSDRVHFVSSFRDRDMDMFLNAHMDKKSLINWTNLYDPVGLMAGGLNIYAYPTYVLFDPSGKKLEQFDGKLPGDLDKYLN